MFDDGYDDYCRHLVAVFESEPSDAKHDASTYCGCVDRLQQNNAAAVMGVVNSAQTELA